MPLWPGSRYSKCLVYQTSHGETYLGEREPYRFVEHADNRRHQVALGDTLFTLAGQYFAPLPRACGFWWAIADFQPDPIIDPTLELTVGRIMFIPALRVLTDIILTQTPGQEYAP